VATNSLKHRLIKKIKFEMKPILFTIFLSAIFHFSAQNREMKSVEPNYQYFKIENTSPQVNKLGEYNSNYVSHPDFGKLPQNAPCEDCIEILSKRSENEKYFVSSIDPSIFYQQKSYGAINFYKNGNWLTIDERLKKIDENLFFAENQIDPTGLNTQYKNTFIKTPFGTVQFNNWKLKGLKNNVNSEIAIADWSDYTVGENGIYIKNIFKGIDLELKFSRGSIKSNFVIVKNYFSEFESLIFEDDFNSTSPGYFVFENSLNATRGVGELLYKVNSENTLEIGMALIYPQGLQKEKAQNAEYIIHENKMGILVPMDWINENLNENNRLIIDPVVTSSNTLAQASITGSGYNFTCFNGFCTYNLSVPTPANATVTDVQWSFNYRAQGGCWMDEGAVTFLLGTCRSPSQNNLFWFCGNPPYGPGDCTGSNISMFTDVSSCLPPPSCAPQNLNFTMRFHRCYGSGSGCSNTCIGALSPWTMTIVGRTLEYTNATPITLNNTTICQGGTINASTVASFGVPPYNYNWSLNSNMSPSNGSGASSTFSFPNSGTFTIYSTVTDACGTIVNSSRTVTVNPTPIVTITPNPQTICSGQGTGLTLTSSVANTTYTWSTSMSGITGATNSSGTGTGANSSLSLNQTLTNNGTTPGTATYTITPNASSCPGAPVAVIVTVNPNPTVTNPGNQTICAGQSTTAINFTGTAGATFNWTNINTTTGLGASGISNIASFVGTNTGTTNNTSTITVTPTFGNCPGIAQNFTITVSPPPTVIAPLSQTICAGASTTAITFTGTATTYNWTNSNTAIGLGANGTGNIASFVGTNTGTTPISGTITVTPVSGTCSGTAQTFTITINPTPTLTAPQDQTLCAGQSTTAINFTGTAGSTYAWTNNNTATGLGANGNGNIPSFTATNTTTNSISSTVTVTPTLGTCPGAPVTFTITVAVTPTVTAPTSQTICAGASTTAITFTGTATTYNWTNSNTAIGLGANGTGNIASFVGTNTGTTPISGTITVTPVSGTCSGTAQTFTININPTPSLTAPQNQTLCAGQNTTAINFTGTAGSTYAWTNNNTATGLGANGTGNIPSFTATNTTTNSISSTVTVTPTLGTCPGAPVTFTITVAVTPTVTAPTSQTICAGASTTAITFTGTATTYNWTNSNTAIGLGANGTGNIASFVGTNTGTTPISGTITVTPVSGTCSGTAQTFTININPTPSLTAPQNQTLCAGQSTTAINFTGTAGSTYAWTNNNTATGLGANGTGNISSFTATNTTTNSISSTVTVTPTLGTCPGAPVTFTITVAVTPTVTAPTSQTICAGASTTAITFAGTATTYNWTNSNSAIGLGANGTGNIASFVGTNTGTTPISGTITITPTSGTCLGIVQTFTITINPSVTPTFTQLGPYCLNQAPATLPTSSTNNPSITGTWNPSTVSTTTSGTQNYTFTPNAGQCATNTTMNIVVNSNITPTFTQLGPFCQNAAPTALPTTSSNTPGITGTWNPTTISTATIGNATYTYTPSPNQCATTITMSITTIVNPTISFTPQTICSGQSVTITPNVTPTGGTYLWSNNQTTSSISVSPSSTTSYSLLYTVTGCNATNNISISVNPNVTPTFGALGPYCQNQTPGILNTTSLNSITGTWNPTTISTTTAGNQTYTFTPDAGVCATNYTQTILVNPIVNPTFNQIGPLCQNDANPALPLSSTNTPSITGTWNPSSISTSTIGTTNYTFTPTAGQCVSTTNLAIDVIASPTPTISASLISGCAPLSTTLSTQSVPNATYTWTSNGVNIGTGASLNSSFLNAGCFDITLSVSLGACQSSSTSNDLICVESAPTAAFTVSPNSFTNSTETINFSNNSTGAIGYSWDFGDGQTSTLENPSHVYSEINSNILATLTASSPFGCTSSFSVVILYIDETVFYVPNTFTPDEDEFNQTWGPIFTKGFDPFNFNVTVYNRWGEIIWESNDAEGRWDGSYGANGLKCPQGVYTWRIDYKPLETDEKLTISGQVNLLR
jgi:gliding motility-associated-like protein